MKCKGAQFTKLKETSIEGASRANPKVFCIPQINSSRHQATNLWVPPTCLFTHSALKSDVQYLHSFFRANIFQTLIINLSSVADPYHVGHISFGQIRIGIKG